MGAAQCSFVWLHGGHSTGGHYLVDVCRSEMGRRRRPGSQDTVLEAHVCQLSQARKSTGDRAKFLYLGAQEQAWALLLGVMKIFWDWTEGPHIV